MSAEKVACSDDGVEVLGTRGHGGAVGGVGAGAGGSEGHQLHEAGYLRGGVGGGGGLTGGV